MRVTFPQRSVQSFVLLGTLVLAFALSACGNNSSSSGTVTLTYGWWSNNAATDARQEAWLQEFTNTHPNIKIKPEILPWPSYWNKVKTTTVGGTAYDIVGMCSCYNANYFPTNTFVDLSKFSDYQSTVANLQPSAVNLYNWNGKQEGLPIGLAVPYMGYNIDMLKAAGLPLPDATKPMTFDQFKSTYGALTKFDSSGKATQYAMDPRFWLDQDIFTYMEGGTPFDSIVNPHHVNYESPQGIAGLTDYLSLFTSKLAPPVDDLNNNAWGPGDLQGLLAGKVAFARIGDWNFGDIASNSYHIGIAPIFSIQKSVASAGANGLTIYRGSKHQKEAWEFVKWATSAEGQAAFTKWGDIPVNTSTVSQLSTLLTPANFVPTVQYAVTTFTPGVITSSTDFGTLVNTTITDMLNGKITPTQAAKVIDNQGNPLLAAQP